MKISRTCGGSISINSSMKTVGDPPSEVKDALKRIKGGKAMSSDVIPIEVWSTLKDVVIV
jgi:hypothetical protein